MISKIEYYKVTEYGFDPEFARMVWRGPESMELEAYRKGEWVDGRDLGNVFFQGEGRVEPLDGDPTA